MSLEQFSPPEIEEIHQTISETMPDGKAWEAKDIEGSNIFGLVRTTAQVFQYVWESLAWIYREMDFHTCIDTIDEWEKSVGLPDNCRPTIALPLDQRRGNVATVYHRTNTSTIGEINDVLHENFPEYTIRIEDPDSVNYKLAYKLPIKFAGYARRSRFVWIVNILIPEGEKLAYKLPIKFRGLEINEDQILCVLRPLAPIDVKIVFSYKTDIKDL